MSNSGITVTPKGNHACFCVKYDDKTFEFIIDEKNLAKFIYNAQVVLKDIRLK